MVYVVCLAHHHGKLDGRYSKNSIKNYAYFYFDSCWNQYLLQWFCFTLSLVLLTYKSNFPLGALWCKHLKWYILVMVTQSWFITICAIISNHLNLVIDSDIEQNLKFRIFASSTLLKCNVTKYSFWSQWYNLLIQPCRSLLSQTLIFTFRHMLLLIWVILDIFFSQFRFTIERYRSRNR